MAIHGGQSPSPFPQPRTALERMLAVTYKAVALLLLVLLHLSLTTRFQRAASCIAATLFVIIETVWTTIAHEDPVSGAVSIRGWTGRMGHSSFAQFWANVMYTPILLFYYRSQIDNPFVRVLLFPLNIWLLEIVEGYVLMFLFGRNVAWEYRGRDAYFHGNIKLQYFLPWLGLGAVVEALWEKGLMPLTNALAAGSDNLSIFLLIAVVLTVAHSPRMGIAGILKSLTGDGFSS